ncbi:MAG: tetratricopeptide repeat protein [Patescibacteria group bacterium]|jgi:predicted Zn-dependent protease
MIWSILVVVAVVAVIVILARRLPDARQKMVASKEVSDQELSLYGMIARADEAFERRRYSEAENLYVKVAVNDPDNPKIYSRLGAIYLEQKNFYDAKDAFLHASKLEPDLASRHINLGLAYMGLKDFFKAVEEFKTALDLDGKNKKYQRLLDKANKYLEKDKKRKTA